MKSGTDFHRPSQRGFTLFELMVSLAVTVVLVLAILALFDFSGRLARVQTNVAEMQQSVRVSIQDTVRLVRMAGRGGLPLGPVPNGLAVEVRNNLPAGATIGGGATPAVVAGSDVLLVRGVFSAPIYQINAADPASFTLAGGAVPNRGTLRVAASTPTGIAQDVEPLRRAVRERIPEALVLVSPRDAALYAVVELDPATSDLGNPDLITVGFRISGGRHTADYARLSRGGGFPLDLTSVAFVGLLEEHRYYLRERFVGADLSPRLARARVFPGTNSPWRIDGDEGGAASDAHPSWSRDLADGILDLQVALGFDTPRGGGAMGADENDAGDDDRIFEAADGRDDDWLFNADEPFNPGEWTGAPLYFVRLNLLARTQRRDPQYQAAVLSWLEDHNLGMTSLNQRTQRMFRRRVQQTVIDVRNL